MSSNTNKTRSNQARAIIELLCAILEENEISSVRAEILRQAKFNKADVAKQMGQVLLSVVCLCDIHTHNENVTEPPKQMMPDEQKMIYIKTKLQSWGYLGQSFARLSHDFSTGSRELLLALGWVIHQKDFIDKLISKRSNPLHQDILSFSKTEEAISREESSPISGHGNQLHLKERIQYHMVLTGKLRMSLRRLYGAYQQRSRITKTIRQSTEGISLQLHLNHLTPLEVHVLRFPGSLKKILQELEKDNGQLTHLLEWKQKESLFWGWMESVLTAHIEDQSRASSASLPDLEVSLEPSVYLPVPSNIGQHLGAARDQLRDEILRHENEMSRVEQIVQRKKVSSVEAEVHKLHMDKELFEQTLKLRSCGIGEEKDSSQLTCYEDTCDATSSRRMHLKHQSQMFGLTQVNKEVRSPYAAKAARQEALLQSVNQEISNLKAKVEKLDKDLHQRQIQNMEKVQELIKMDESVICIEPRSLKQYYNT